MNSKTLLVMVDRVKGGGRAHCTTRSRIHERTISLRFLGIIFRVLQGVTITKRCQLSWLTNSAHYCPNAGGWVSGSQPMRSTVCKQCTWSPNKLWRSNAILNLWFSDVRFQYTMFTLQISFKPLLFGGGGGWGTLKYVSSGL